MEFLLKLLLNKYVMYGLLALAAAGTVYAGVTSIENAYHERAALRVTTKQQSEDLIAMAGARAVEEKAAQEAADKLKKELDDRDAAAAKQAARSEQLQKDLSNAKSSLARWRATAGANLTACLNTALPDGMFPDASAPGPEAGDGAGGVRPAADKPAPQG